MCILFVEGELVSEGKGWTFAFFLCVLILSFTILLVFLRRRVKNLVLMSTWSTEFDVAISFLVLIFIRNSFCLFKFFFVLLWPLTAFLRHYVPRGIMNSRMKLGCCPFVLLLCRLVF